MKTKQPTQRDYIRNHLLEFGSIEPLTALREYGAYRLGAVIHVLRHEENMPILTQRMEAFSKITGRPVMFANYILDRQLYQLHSSETENLLPQQLLLSM